MSDTEERLGGSGGNDDEVSLPRATVQKLIQELLPSDMSVAKEVKDLIIEACTGESNDAQRTYACAHTDSCICLPPANT